MVLFFTFTNTIDLGRSSEARLPNRNRGVQPAYPLRPRSCRTPTYVCCLCAGGAGSTQTDPTSTSISNIRTIIGPLAITALAAEENLTVVREATFTPEKYVGDGRSAAEIVRGSKFLEEVETVLVGHDRERGLVLALRESMARSIYADVPGAKVGIRTMDVWCALLEPKMT